MRKLKEVLRLHSLGLKQQQIARSCQIAQSTVHQYLKTASAAGVTWPLPADWDERQLEQAFCDKPQPHSKRRKKETPDFGAIRQQLQSQRHLTLQLIWEEYCQDHPDGYRYSRFCELYGEWVRHLDVVLRHDYRAGEKLFVDYAGDKIPIYDQQTGEVDFHASLFVAVLGASSYTFAEATRSQDLSCWIDSHVRALEFFGGSPEVVIPDFVPGNKIGVMWQLAFCGHRRQDVHQSRRSLWIMEHNLHSDSSHFRRSAFLRHPPLERYSTEGSIGGVHAATAACLVRKVISA